MYLRLAQKTSRKRSTNQINNVSDDSASACYHIHRRVCIPERNTLTVGGPALGEITGVFLQLQEENVEDFIPSGANMRSFTKSG